MDEGKSTKKGKNTEMNLLTYAKLKKKKNLCGFSSVLLRRLIFFVKWMRVEEESGREMPQFTGL